MGRTDYGYDWVGNRTSPTAAYNDADQLTSYSGNTYNYNTYGDMTSGAGRTYTTADNGKVWRIAYNSVNYDNYFITSGLRYNSSVGAVSTNYVYDVTAGIPAVVAEANGGTVTNYYVREPGGELVMRQNGTDSKYYHFDELGSTLFLTDASGVQTDKYVYNAWGKVVSSAGTTVNPYKYIGQLGYYSDSGTGLLSLGVRFYDPEAGVFTQRDEAKDGLSYYAYTSGQVMTAVDPWGEASVKECLDKFYKIANQAWNLVEKLRRYDPDEDGKGGFFCRWKKKNNGLTDPGEHYLNIKKAQKSIKEDITWYIKNCINKNKDNNPRVPRWIDKLVNRKIEKPVIVPIVDGNTIAKGAVALSGGYLLYRCGRMLPSLAPLLWWTIPGNLACP